MLYPSAVGCSFALLVFLAGAANVSAAFKVFPPEINLDGNFARAQLVVMATNEAGAIDVHSADFTSKAAFRSSAPKIVSVEETGRLLARGNGEATIAVTVDGVSRVVPVHVRGIVPNPPIDFMQQVMPVIAKAGCNAGACHASQYGKGGFKLSVFGYAPDEDYRAIVRDGVGRRVNRAEPTSSLVLLKPTLGIPHEGGHRLQSGSADYEIFRQWIARGTPPPKQEAAMVVNIAVFPRARVGDVGLSQQLRVTATYSDGSSRDVTHWTKFDTIDDSVVEVDSRGLVRAIGKGQGGAMVRFGGQAEVATFSIPYAKTVQLDGWVDQNFIDTLAAKKFREVGISPSPLCDDAAFLRRAYLDAIGTLPTLAETRSFLESRDSAKRSKLIDRLLALTGDPAQDIHNNDYAAYWALKWADLIRSNSNAIGEQGMWALHNWLTESFRENKPFDRFTRELITARGSTYCNGPANYFRIASNPQDLTEATAQLFLGERLQCAKCHHHPYESVSQDDYYGFAAFFARVGNKRSQEFGIFARETVVMVRPDGEVRQPRTGKVMPPTPLHGKPVAATFDRRQPLAQWLTSPDNSLFARNIVNRYVGYLLGRPLVEPIDDLRTTNPPSNPELMDALAADFVKSGYDVKRLIRIIMDSRLYQLDSQPTKGNAPDDRFYSHYHVKRLPAEPLLDAIDRVTGVPTKFDKMPLGTKAIELPDARYNNYFLITFGKPRREAVCECERVSLPNLAQALDTLNGDLVSAKIADRKGRIAQYVAAKTPADAVIDELYLVSLCRHPSAKERAACNKLLADAPDPRTFYEDMLWSLVNSKHFLFVR